MRRGYLEGTLADAAECQVSTGASAVSPQVYSVVDEVVRVHLLVRDGHQHVNVNEELVRLGIADRCEESFLSKVGGGRSSLSTLTPAGTLAFFFFLLLHIP